MATNSSTRMQLWLLLLTLSHFVCAFASSPRKFNLFLTPTVYVEHENVIPIRTWEMASMVRLTTSVGNGNKILVDDLTFPIKPLGQGLYGADIVYRPSVVPPTDPGVQLRMNFTIEFCSDRNCLETVNETQSETVWFARRSPLLLSEVEKPIYRPGETVRFRFVALRPEVTEPLPASFRYPKRVLLDSADGLEYELRDSSGEMQSTEDGELLFEKIVLTDSQSNVVKQWLNVTSLTAAQLHYTLLADDSEGTWHVTAHLANQLETVSFLVQHYVLPRFVMHIQTPKMLTFDVNYTEFSVCAKYTNGPPMLGSVRAVLCVCDNTKSNDPVLLDNQTCPVAGWDPDPRPCVPTLGQLQSNGCVSFNVSTERLEFHSSRRHQWNQFPVVCAEGIEAATGSNVTKCEIGDRMDRRRQKLQLNFPSVYKSGLPLFGTVTITDFKQGNFEKAYITVSLTESRDSCWRIRRTGSNRYTTRKLVNPDGSVEFIIPPIESKHVISLKATLHVSSQNESFDATAMLAPHPSIPVEYHTIRPFISPATSASVQQWPMQTSVNPAQCPGTVSFTVIANVPLGNRTMYVQSVVRGRHIHEQIAPVAMQEPACTDQDGHFGHYRCLDPTDSTKIQCLAGWTGQNCMRPICSSTCHAIGGTCDVPDTCMCNEGWSGEHCDQCSKAPGCVHGQCVQGHDCVCDSGWMGPLCDHAKVVYEPLPDGGENGEEEEEKGRSTVDPIQVTSSEQLNTTTASHAADSALINTRTIFEREIRLPIDERWGPEATVVLYFYDDREGEAQIVPMSLTITGIENCTNPASVLQTQSVENGIRFDTHEASPGQPLQMSVTLRGLNRSTRQRNHANNGLSDEVCFVRLSDLSLTNFEQTPSILDLKQYATKLQAHQSNMQWTPKNPTDVAETFQAAGIRLVTRPHVAYVHVSDFMCRSMNYVARMPGAVDSPPMDGMPMKLSSVLPSVNAAPPKPRLRDFFPEVWLFDVIPMEHLGQKDGQNVCGFRKNVTAPDTITTWQASAYCTTRLQGLWVPPTRQLTVSMPFFVELTLPKQVKRGEILYLPVSVFVSAGNPGDTSRDCLEVHVTTSVADTDWLRIGSSSYTGCVCPGRKETFQLGLLAKGVGMLNVTAEAYATAGSRLCNENLSGTRAEQQHTLSDLIRRQVRVVPEGKPKEMTMGTIVCLQPNETQAAHEFPIPTVQTMIPNSLRLYVSYSDEVLGPALRNLDKLVQLPVGCGEQNMLLVAPNVYVLDYLTTAPVVNEKETERLKRTARAHVATGYKRQLGYRLVDGSYSAFGQLDGEGSTWLTAFVLRVFARAYKIDASLEVNWEQLVKETTSFLFSRMTNTTESGCYAEKGRVIHAAMQGSLQSGSKEAKSLLLASYVLAALHEIDGPGSAPIPASWIASRAKGQECFYQLVEAKINESPDMQQFETYELAQVAYTMSLLYPHHAKTRLLQQELVKRQHVDLTSGSGERLFWTAMKTESSGQKSVESMDIETTCYAYLALTQTSPLAIDPFAVIRWLSAQQTSTGGFKSTQDTTLALQVISDGAKRLGLKKTSLPESPLEVTVQLHPDGEQIRDSVTVDKQRVLNQFAISVEEGQQMDSFRWNVTRTNPSGTQCLIIQNTLLYNVPESTDMSEEAAFAVSVHVDQSNSLTQSDCRVANLTICLRPGSTESMQRDSGMLLVQVLMVSGWSPIPDRLIATLGNQSESPRQAEFDEDQGTTSVYFDGFSEEEAQQQGGWSQIKRCFTLDILQKAYVENAEPARLTVADYYDTGRSVEVTYRLDGCKSSWGLDEQPRTKPMTTEQPELGGTTPTVTEEPLRCPICDVDDGWNDTLVTFLSDALCQIYSDFYLLDVRAADNGQFNATLITIFTDNRTASWNATLNSTSLQDCPCAAVKDDAKLVLISDSGLAIYPGQADVSLSYVPPKTLLVPAQDIMWAVEELRGRWLEADEAIAGDKPDVTKLSFDKWGCRRIPNLYRYLKYKFL